MPENPIDGFLGAIAHGADAGRVRRQLKKENRHGMNFLGLDRPIHSDVPSFTGAVFQGFRNAQVSPELQLRRDQLELQRENFNLQNGLAQRSVRLEREGLREAAALQDALDAEPDLRKRLSLVSQSSNLAAKVPKIYGVIRQGVLDELSADMEAQKFAASLEDETTKGAIDAGIRKSFTALAERDPGLAFRLNEDFVSGDVDRRNAALDQLSDASRQFEGSFGEAMRNVELAKDRGDTEEISIAMAALNKITAPSGMRFELDPSTGKVLAASGAGLQSEMGALPLGVRGKFQEKIRAGDFTRSLINEIRPLLSNDTTGLRGVIRNIAINKFTANARQLFNLEDKADTDLVQATSLFAMINSEAIKALKPDSQMNMREFSVIQNALPELNASDTLSVTLQKLNTLADSINLGEFLNRRSLGESQAPLFDRLGTEDTLRFLRKGVTLKIFTRNEATAIASELLDVAPE